MEKMSFSSLAFSRENREAPDNLSQHPTQKTVLFCKSRGNQKMLVNNQIKIESNDIVEMNAIKIPVKSSSADQKSLHTEDQCGEFKISTSNFCKKLIGITRQTLLGILSPQDEYHFLRNFQSFKNTKVYFFIILAHVKILLPLDSLETFTTCFSRKINNKIYCYRREIEKTKNASLRKMKLREISDIESALTVCHLYLNGHIDEALSTFYKKENTFFRTTKQYCQNLQIIMHVQGVLTKQVFNYPSPISFNFSQQDKAILPKISKQVLQSELAYPFLNETAKFQEQEFQNDISLKWPLLDLQNSFPIYKHFFPTIFNYGGDYAEKLILQNWNSQLKYPLLQEKQSILQAQDCIKRQP